MRYFEVSAIDQVKFCEDAEISTSPDGSGYPCIKVGDKYYLQHIQWSEWDSESKSAVFPNGSWVSKDDESAILECLACDTKFRELSEVEIEKTSKGSDG